MIFPMNVVKYKIISFIYDIKSIKISSLIKELKISQKSCYKYINELLKSQVLEEKLEGTKPLLRILKPNLKSESGRLCFSLVELQRKIDFFNNHKELVGAFKQFESELKDLVSFGVIFGSYARKTETKDSDIDIAIFSNKEIKKNIEKISERSFSSLKNRVSIRVFNVKDFNKKDELISQIIKDHIVIVSPYKFVKLLENIIN